MAEAADADKDLTEGTNMENYGGKEHRAKQQAIAQNQAEWKNAGDELGVQTWRIQKFKVVPQPNFNGEFYDGDSYIVLNTYEVDDKKSYNAHFWLGKDTTQDEAGTAAFKVVELDDFLGDEPVQMREVMGCESKEFRDLFRGGIRTLVGGEDTGFSHVKPDEYAPRLLLVSGNAKKVNVTQVPLSVNSLNCADVFLLDLGLELIQFNGSKSSPHEKRASNQLMNKLASERNGKVKSKDTIDSIDEDTSAATKFWDTIGERPSELAEESNKNAVKNKLDSHYDGFEKKLYHVVDDTCTGKDFDKSILAEEGDDVIIVDIGPTMFLWVGKKASLQEKAEGMSRCIAMLSEQSRPQETRIVRVIEGRETDEFNAAFN